MAKPPATTERKPLENAAWCVLELTDQSFDTRLPGDWSEYLPRIRLCIEALLRKREPWKAMESRGECLIAAGDTHEAEWRQRCMLTEVRMSLIGVKTTQNHRKVIRDALIALGNMVTKDVWASVIADIDFDKPFDLRKRVEQLRAKNNAD